MRKRCAGKYKLDSPEIVQTCLNCTRPNCTGSCNRIHGRKARGYEYQGEVRPLSEWAAMAGVNTKTLYMRLYHGKTLEEAMAMGGAWNK